MLCEELLRPLLLRRDSDSLDELEEMLEIISEKSKTSKMWVDLVIKSNFLTMLFIRNDHEGDFALHLFTAKKMLDVIYSAHKHMYLR